MTATFEAFIAEHPDLGPEMRRSNSRERLFPLRLPAMQPSRVFGAAWLVLPKDFPDACALIRLSKDAVLRIPHVEADGKLCFSGDPGPAANRTLEDRVTEMLQLFNEEFLMPWQLGQLDFDFEEECRTYWQIWVEKNRSKQDAIKQVYTVDKQLKKVRLISARLMLPGRILVIDDENGIANNLVVSLGLRATQMIRVLVADISIDFRWTPLTWPKSIDDINLLLKFRLTDQQYRKFSKNKKHHRVVLFRSPNCNHAYWMPNGPLTVITHGTSKFAISTRTLRPLLVERLDPEWTYGRDQISEVADRQQKHVLVLGAGALASPVVDQLARAGIGKITLVDPQLLASPNIGRHLLGAESLQESKAYGVALRVGLTNPASRIVPYKCCAEPWLRLHGLNDVDVVLDLTGEPDVRFALETARQVHDVPLLVAWIEPFVAAAHAVCLPIAISWFKSGADPLLDIQAITWPDDVIQKEPGCNSTFQSYTASQANYAVSLATEAALALIDGHLDRPIIRSWVRGRRFLDRHYGGLELQPWAKDATELDGVLIERDWNE